MYKEFVKAGFIIEQMVEETDKETMASTPDDDRSKKAKMLPLSFIFNLTHKKSPILLGGG